MSGTTRVGGPVVAVAALCRRGDEVLVERRGHGAAAGEWGLPGGPVGAGELLAEATVRHLGDATGLEALCGPFLDWAESLDAGGHLLVMRFEAVVLDGTEPPGPGVTALETDWVATAELVERRLEAGLAEFLADQGLIDTVL